MKKLFTLFCALCAAVTLWANGVCIGGIYYLLDGEEATVTYTGTGYNDNTYVGAIRIPDTFTYQGDLYTVVSIGEAAFYGCTGLTSITIPSTVWNIDMYAFSACSSLSSVSMGDNIETLGEAAFSDCTSLTTISFPATVWSLGDYVLSGDSALTSITCLATEPPLLDGEDGFGGVTKTIPLYVPATSVSSYQAANQWKDFNVQAYSTPTGLNAQASEPVSSKFYRDGAVYLRRGAAVYGLNGRKVK